MNQVFRTDQFRSALKEIGKYIARESGSRDIAIGFLHRIDEKCQAYARQPGMGDMRPDLGEEIRCFPVGSYVVFYQPVEQEILLLAIIHGARDIPVVFQKCLILRNSS